jgi:pimeloyl-ACP methyl ester carboxylesterase
MNPVYFGSAQKSLFGIHHPPLMKGQGRESAIVLCYPMAHEYFYVHRAFRQLATRLARAGFHTLRFDYYGFGDSSGDSEESDIDQWIDDISTAISEAKIRSGLRKVALIGLKLGASASVLAAARRDDIESLVLWEPILDGRKYVEELFALHDNWASENLPSHGSSTPSNGSFEIIGMPLSPRIRAGLEGIDLMKLQKPLAKNILAIENSKHLHGKSFNEIVRRLGNEVEYQPIPVPTAWAGGAGMDTIYVPGQTLNLIVSWISKVSR